MAHVFLYYRGRVLHSKVDPEEVLENSKKRKQEYLLTQPSIDGVENSDVPMEIVNKFVFEETPKRKGRIFGLGKLGVARYKSHSTSSYSCDPMLEASLKEKEARIEALETQMAEEKAENKRRTDEMAKEIAENKKSSETMMRFMEDMRMRFPNSSS
ncbi:hypothetical protein ISN45_At05g028860 [Arabidopsis thaliana x Arabidopsis arenosa]|uniref:Uncharacterized protein n=1 Tax=Arabidopsis thaliana x Arabidopsis arenosa TaxID=1240361 RepID=A0A8T2CWP0_9BRAS|nr:hypothetical protein ISN45_At05g028860 [Arabidopsis thaliana x Arabidopsis arenosa]